MFESIGIPVLTVLLPVIAALVTALLVWGGRKLLKHFNISNADLDARLQDYVKIGVDYANAWAVQRLKATGTKPASEDKLGLATRTVLGELDKAGITKVGADLIIARIESFLADKKAAEGK